MTETFRLTVLGTTDLHSHIANWDYFSDAPYHDVAGNEVGLAQLSTLITAVRAERGAQTVLLVDSGDTIEGTPLAYWAAKREPNEPHPMALAMNQLGYDAAALGNHEFNYGLDFLHSFASQLTFPLLCANALDVATQVSAFPSYLIKSFDTPLGPLQVGIVGLVTPGCAIWDRKHLEGRIAMQGIVEQGAITVAEMKAAGADVVVVCCHSGADTSSSYGDALPWPENASTLLAQSVPGIDVILVGHAHVEIVQRMVVNTETHRPVLLTEPLKWGMRLSVVDLALTCSQGTWQVDSRSAVLLNTRNAVADPAVVQVTAAVHERVRAYVNEVIGSSTERLSAAAARYRVTPIIDLVHQVQAGAVQAGLRGTPYAELPLLSVVAPFNRQAILPAGSVTIRDIAALYNYDNTLVAVQMTGLQLRAYLEHSARYYRGLSGAGPWRPDEVTNAPSPTAPAGIPDYNCDTVAGSTAPLAYDIDLARPVGSRISGLSYAGLPVAESDVFVMAVNSYRQSGGGGFPWLSTAPMVYDAHQEVRQLIIDWVSAVGVVQPGIGTTSAWRLVYQGLPLTLRQQ